MKRHETAIKTNLRVRRIRAGRAALVALLVALTFVLAGCPNPTGGDGGGTPPVAAEPVFTPAAGTFSQDIAVSMASETPGASVHYTVDGTEPTTGSPTFDQASPIAVAGDGTAVTIRAFATAPGFEPSAVVAARYTIDYGRVSTPQFNPAPGTYPTDITVAIATMTTGATIYYTIDGSDPTTISPVFDAASPIEIAGDGTTVTIRAFATAPAYDPSVVATASYTIDYPPTVTTDAASGTGSLVEVVTNADPGSVVVFSGDYTIVANQPLPATPAPTWLDLSKDITIDGAGHSIVLDAAQFGRHFTIRDTDTSDSVRPTLTLRNLTLRNGLGRTTGGAPVNGGAIYNYLANVVLENVTIESNSVAKNSSEGGSGGALVVDGGTATVRDTTFLNNRAGLHGGAILVVSNGSLVVDNAVFRSNQTGEVTATAFDEAGGGAVHVQTGSQAVVRDSTFEANLSLDSSGGAMDVRGSGTVINSTFTRNVADEGGGAIVVGGGDSRLRVHGSYFHGNSAANSSTGGAILGLNFSTGEITVVSSVFVRNRSDLGGGAIRFLMPATVSHSTFVDNTSPATEEDIVSVSGTGISNSLVIGDTVSANAVNASVSDADLSALGSGNTQATVAITEAPDPGPNGTWNDADDNYGTVRPVAGSAAIDAGARGRIPPDVLDLDGDGNTSEPWPFDITGSERSAGTAPDAGAFEVQ